MNRLDRTLSEAARAVLATLEQRSYDAHHRHGESLVRHLFCHELLSLAPGLKARLWTQYRPWPEESGESIDLWIDGAGQAGPAAVELHAGDPRSEAATEGARVLGELISDVLELATALRHRGLERGYVLLFAPSRFVANEASIGRLTRAELGHPTRVGSDALHPHTSDMDWADFEELLHPHEMTPETLELTLLDRGAGRTECFWLWAVSLPDTRGGGPEGARPTRQKT